MVVFSLLISLFFSCLKSNITEDKIYAKQQQWFYSVSLGSFYRCGWRMTLTKFICTCNCKFSLGIEFAVETLKSFILTMALIDNHLSVEKAVALSRLEVEFQVCETN